MKKLYLLFGLIFLLLFSVSAQNNPEDSASEQKKHEAINDEIVERKNFILGIGIKGNVYMNYNGANDLNVWENPTFGGNLFAGKWFSQYLGSRIVVEGGKLHPNFLKRTVIIDENYFLSRLDILFDATSCLRKHSPERIYNLIPYLGFGGVHVFNVKNPIDRNVKKSSTAFALGCGLWNTFRISKSISAYFNMGLDMVDNKLDGYAGGRMDVNGITSGSIGLIINFD